MSTTSKSDTPSKPAVKRAATRKKATKPKTTATKPKAAPPAAKSALRPKAPAAKAAQPTVVDAPKAVILGPVMRKKELTDTIVTRTGMKKKDVKPVVEQMLAVMGEALGDNRELNLPPFGQLKVRREKTLAKGRMVVAKIRQTTPPTAEAKPTAEPSEK